MMRAEYIDLAWWQVAIAVALVLVNAAISLLLGLGLERRLLIAAVRMIVQLTLVGFLLRWIFEINSLLAVLAIVSLMTVIAGTSAVQRVERSYAGVYQSSLLSVWASSWIVVAVGTLLVVQPSPWWQPQYLIPMAGMILGNALSGVSLGLDRFLAELHRERGAIEAKLSLGATCFEAMREHIQSALRTGMVPILNTMAVAGIVSLPGMMTGQLMSGVEPTAAVRYQIMIMCLIAATVGLSTLLSILLCFRRLTASGYRVRWELLDG